MIRPLVNPWLGAALVLITFSLLLGALRLYQRQRAPHPELVRKLFHILMGLFTLTLPWLFTSPWPVLILTGLTIMVMLALRCVPGLKQRFGSVLGGVERSSLGEVYFPLSVGLLFYLAQGNPLFYCIPILILTLADAVAALVGVHYGTVRYKTVEGQKSAEGSVAFFTVAFFSVHVPLLLWSNTGRAETLLIALILGLLVMIFEAVAWRGLDNLFIPLFSFILLKLYLSMTVADLIARLIVTMALALFVFLYRQRTTLNETGLLGAVLIGYICWALGGWR
jgi:phytol kinase